LGRGDERYLQDKLRAEKWDAGMDALEANWLKQITATRAEYSPGLDKNEPERFSARTGNGGSSSQ